ncbi:hypothetical protein [Thalassospira mesophila]|uniref:hypothetical protein n=1 Tax=Thalassospira mesophila TaxID=1293891 RepID=UPI000A1E80C7|nr:hypothetical protein [Thalassospira mesophila]
MSLKKQKITEIPFDDKLAIHTAIQNRENIEIIRCQGRMAVAALFVQRTIASEGLQSLICTAHAPKAPKNNKIDYEIVRFPINGSLKIIYVNKEASSGKKISTAYQKAKYFGEQSYREALRSADETWDKHAPSKEAIVGTAFLGLPGHLILGADGVKEVGAKVLSKTTFKTSDVKINPDTTVHSTETTNANSVEKPKNTTLNNNTELTPKISPWAIFGGAIVGIAAVAAAPFTGGGSVLGAASLLGSLSGAAGIAAAGAAAGAAVGGAVSTGSQKQAFQAGHETGLATNAGKIQDLEARMTRAAQRYEQQNKTNEFIICLFAVGAAIAACDGNFHKDEESNLKEFILGALAEAIPTDLEGPIYTLLNNPPNFNGAIQYIEKLDRKIWPVIDDVLTIVSEADTIITPEEEKFIGHWNEYKSINTTR